MLSFKFVADATRLQCVLDQVGQARDDHGIAAQALGDEFGRAAPKHFDDRLVLQNVWQK